MLEGSPRTPRLEQAAAQTAAALPPLLVEAERVAATVAQGVHGRRRAGVGETYWQHRAYQPGDGYAEIDWRQSARSDRIYVRQNEWEASSSVWIWRSGAPGMAYASSDSTPTKLRRADVAAAALASLLVRADEQIARLGGMAGPARGQFALTRLVSELEANEGWGVFPEPTLELPRYARIVLIGDFLNPAQEWLERIAGFARAGVRGHLLQVLDPAEEDFPFSGRNEFRAVGAEDRLVVGRAEALASGYRAKLAAHREAVGDGVRRFGWTFASHRTDRPAQTALLALYLALGGDSALRGGAR